MTSITILVDVTHFHSVFSYAFRSPIELTNHAIRKFHRVLSALNRFFRFDGETFATEPSSNYSHERAIVLGIYKGQPFVTGYLNKNVKTEIFDYALQQWTESADYPFARQNQ